jgi:hypothetical protein
MKHFGLLFMAAVLPLGMAAAALADTPAMSGGPTVTIPLKTQNGSGESGTATLEQMGADVVVHLTISKGSTSDAQPAHIHPGTCAKLDPAPKYPLSNVVDGTSVTTLKGMKLSDLQTGAFAINVHKSTSDLKTYVACGDIPKASSGAM